MTPASRTILRPMVHSFVLFFWAGLLMFVGILLSAAVQADDLETRAIGDWRYFCEAAEAEVEVAAEVEVEVEVEVEAEAATATEAKTGTEAKAETDTNERCRIQQSLVTQEGARVASFIIRRESGRLGLIMHVPLGIDLPGGVELAVEGLQPVKVPLRTCVAKTGCTAIVGLTDESVERLAHAKKLVIGILSPGSDKRTKLSFSTEGLKAALEALLGKEISAGNRMPLPVRRPTQPG